MGSEFDTELQVDNYACSKPPVDFKTKVPFWPGQGQDMSGQSGTFGLKSTGGFEQV